MIKAPDPVPGPAFKTAIAMPPLGSDPVWSSSVSSSKDWKYEERVTKLEETVEELQKRISELEVDRKQITSLLLKLAERATQAVSQAQAAERERDAVNQHLQNIVHTFSFFSERLQPVLKAFL
jgi:chromosome segregation ATPase